MTPDEIRAALNTFFDTGDHRAFLAAVEHMDLNALAVTEPRLAAVVVKIWMNIRDILLVYPAIKQITIAALYLGELPGRMPYHGGILN